MSSTTISGGVDLQGESINIGGDVVGRDKIVNTTIYGAVINEAPREPVIKRRDARPQPPRAPLDFFDRAGELAQVEQLITQGKPVAICGSDGAGKSALLRQAANGSAARALPDGVILLEGLDEHGHTLLPGDAIQRWFDAFYLSEPPLKVTSASAQPYLSQLRPLVLLDHVTLDADQLRPLLDLFPNSPALIARPSALVGLARPIKLGPLPRHDAIELFSATSVLLIDDAKRSSADAICALLNDVPLAIVRAADVIREMNLPLDQAQTRLEAAPSAAGDSITIGLSRAAALIQSVLTPLEQQVLGVAANVSGISIDPQTIAGIISGHPSTPAGGQIQVEGEWVTISGVRLKRRDGAPTETSESAAPPDKDSVEAAIEHLKALGLLHANSPRVRLDAGLREFWQGAGDERTIKDQLLAQLLIDQMNGRFADDVYCANELGQVLGAIEYAAQTQHWTAAITLSRAIDRYLTLHGLWDAWGQIADRVLQSARAAGDRSAEAWALHQLGTRAIASSQTQAIELLKQALGVRKSIGETEAAAVTQHNLDVLIPPPIPPQTGEKTIGPGGLSGLAKILIALLILGAVASGVYSATRPAVTPPLIVDTPIAQITPTPRPPATFTPLPPTDTPISTPTDTPHPTETFTPTPTPTESPTPRPSTWPIIFFSGVNAERGFEVFSINSDGSNRTSLTKGLPQRVAGACIFPAGSVSLSPDGKQIAYTQYAMSPESVLTGRLHLMSADGTAVQTIRVPTGGLLSNPSWSPDSSRVAVEVLGGDRSVVQILERSGELISTLTLESPARVFNQVSWSPDSQQIIFSDGNRNDNGTSTNLFVASADSRERYQLTKSGRGEYALLPAWSPDGKRIAYLNSGPNQSLISVINSDGSLVATFPLISSEFFEFAWSPDGTQLAITSNSPNEQSLSIMDVASGKVARLVDKLGSFVGPVWSPGGQQIAFTVFDTPSYDSLLGGPSIYGGEVRSELYIVNVDGSGLQNLTNSARLDDFTAYPVICAQCPHIYTYNTEQRTWSYDTTILYKLVGKERETVQTRPLRNFDGRLLIHEIEPEISFIDQLYVIVTDGSGVVHTLPAQIDQLRAADGRYVVLRTGDKLLVTFEDFAQIRSPQQALVVAKGYYDPLPPGLVTVP
jgi:Tol biopolymer transport system component